MLAAVFGVYAGDAAAFVDMGISSDGKTYVFGEYGKTDGKYQGYAEIYTVNIEKNDFVDGGIFRTVPSASTSSKSGKTVFDELKDKANWYLKKYKLQSVKPENLLYVREDEKDANREIVFKDFEGSTTERTIYYHVKLVKSVEGTGLDIHSSFFITLEKQDADGSIISRNTVGSPDIKRKSVSEYKIDRIFSDASGRNLVFVVEKTVKDSTGTSIRYMVETIRL